MSDTYELQDYTNLCFAGSQQETNSLLDDPNLVSAIKKMMEKQLQIMMFPTVKQIMDSFLGTLKPMMENLVRNIVKEQIELAQERFLTREKGKSQDEMQSPQPRCLELQFSDRFFDPVYTGKQIKGERGNSVRLALVDSDGNPVSSGPEASAKVKIMVLQEGADDGDNSSMCGECDTMVDKKKGRKPLLSRNYFKLKEGIADLDDFKFKNKAKWTKSCEVKLVARVVENLNGTTVKDATTESFPVMDCRGTLYKKHHPPLLSDDVWRLEKISRGGELYKRLQKAKIKSVEEFLISLNLDAQSLQKTLNVSAEKFKAIADHAQTCSIGENLYKYYSPSCERKVAVVFDAVGRLQGLLRGHRFVPVDKLAKDEKVDAHKMVESAFKHREEVQPIDNVASIADLPSVLSHDINTSNSPSPSSGSPRGSNFGNCNMSDGIDHALSCNSSRHMSPSSSFFDGLSFFQMDYMDSPNQALNYSGSFRNSYLDIGDDEYQRPLFINNDDNLQWSNSRIEEAQAGQSTAAAGYQRAAVHSSNRARLRWRSAAVSVRKRIIAPEDTHAQKKQKHC